MRLIGWLCVMAAGISLIGGLLTAHFAPRRHRYRQGTSDFRAFREDVPGFLPGLILAAALLILGLVILLISGRDG